MLVTNIGGIFILIILANIIGENGTGYLAASLETYVLLTIITTACLPEAIEKIIRTRLAKAQYKNADKVLRGALIYGITISGICTLAGYLFCDFWMETVLLVPYGSYSLKLLLPIVFINTGIAVLQGYFQGTGTAMPTIVSKIIKDIFFLTFGLIFCYIVRAYGEKVSVLLRNEDFKAMYASGGISLGMMVGTFLVFLFLLFIFLGANKWRKQQKSKDSMRMTENYLDAIRILILSMSPYIVCGIVLNLLKILGLAFFQRKQENIYVSISQYGAFYGKYELWVTLIVLLIGIGVLSLVRKIVQAVKREEYKQAKEVFHAGFLFSYMTSIFFAVCYGVIGTDCIKVLYKYDQYEAGKMLQYGGGLIPLMVVGCFFAGIAWENGKVKHVLFSLLSALVIFLISLIVILNRTNGSIMSLIYSQMFFGIIVCGINGFFVFRILRFNLDYVRMLLFPTLAAVASGVIMLLLNKVLSTFLGDGVRVLLCILVGGITNFILVMVFRCARERELAILPGGRILVGIGKLLHFL